MWNNVTETNDVNTLYDNFHETFKEIHDLFFQPKKVKFNKNFRKKEPWMTKGLLISCLTKLKLEKNHALNPTVVNWNLFKVYRNLYNKTLKASKKQYYCSALEDNSNNLKNTRSILNKVLMNRK
jgi:hypothetical protein